MFLQIKYSKYKYKYDLAINYVQGLICNKTQPTQTVLKLEWLLSN